MERKHLHLHCKSVKKILSELQWSLFILLFFSVTIRKEVYLK